MKPLDLKGKKFGKLTALHPVITYHKTQGRKWMCRCDCGNYSFVTAKHLNNGSIKSCGCVHKLIVQQLNYRHGECKTRLYHSWLDMRQRCCNKRNSAYQRYGGRGIFVCNEWDDYLVFKKWALSNGYKNNLTIERIDNDGNYTPSNCKWITLKEQQKNKTYNWKHRKRDNLGRFM